MIEDLLREVYIPFEQWKIVLDGFIETEPDMSERFKANTNQEVLYANEETVEHRLSLALKIILKYMEIVTEGRINSDLPRQDIETVRNAGLNYVDYLKRSYRARLNDAQIGYDIVVKDVKKNGLGSGQHNKAIESPEYGLIQKMVALDAATKLLSGKDYSKEGIKKILDSARGSA
jgi:hypothetical protein